MARKSPFQFTANGVEVGPILKVWASESANEGGQVELYDSDNIGNWVIDNNTGILRFLKFNSAGALVGELSLTPEAYITQNAWVDVALQNSWATYGGGFPALAWRKDKQGHIWLRGTIASGTTTDNTVVGILPVSITPGGGRVIPVVVPAGVTGASNPQLLVDVSGNAKIYGCQGATYIHIYGSYSLD
jgi:hypothetical protein